MNDDQQKLFNRADHANLGRDWEAELETVHEWYRLSGKADIVKNPHEWVFISNNDYQKKSSKYDPRMFAVTDNGTRLMRSRSDVDYSGGGKGFSICFDAKSSKGRLFPLSNVSPHQLARLRQSASCGTIAGFMIKMKDLDRVFFFPVGVMNSRFDNWQRQPGKRVKAGIASLSIEDLTNLGIEIPKHRTNQLWDYLPRLLA